jgi:nitrogen regulatory protein PII-like uncharacterized protein
VLPSDFEGVLVKSGHEKLLKKIANLSESKVSCGRIIAEEITEKKLSIPSEFVEIINLL